MTDALIQAVAYLFTLQSLSYLALGTGIGLLFGAVPGLGGTTALALLIPLTFGMDPDAAIVLVGGIMGGVPFGGSLSAILLNTPGAAPNAATCFDGYPLARQGKAGAAIGAAATASALGGLIGVAFMLAVIPIAKAIVLLFGPPEFFMLAVLGLSAIAVSTGGKLLRGLISGGFGLMLAFVGFDEVGGGLRYTAGVEYLWDGVQLVPALIGLFAIAEMIQLSTVGGRVAIGSSTERLSHVFDGVKHVFGNLSTLLRGSAIGAFVGAVPGIGGTVASFLSYSTARQLSKDPESFGQGNIQGVIASEAANNAKDGGSLIPTLAFGIPGSAEMAVFLGVLVLHGLEPGPRLLLDHEDLIYGLIMALSLACVMASVAGLLLARYLVLITRTDVRYLAPIVTSVALIGAYALQSNFGDVIAAAMFGVIGYLMVRYDYPRITLVIALVLGSIAERSYHQSLMMSDGSYTIFFTRPVADTLLALIIVSLALPALKLVTRKLTGSGHGH
ncbi:MAG: tripartite tricarboxylate transporter permease [Gammaproteobacteria bacterium]|nr:tripartite tricarboxylate transporter permease [Gammaproteobacteria bacterium]MDH3505722.1 tripartite tricarboxylate transporter permease [Gammaproteobacteria bacterium]